MQIKLGFSLQNKGRLKSLIVNRVPQKTAKNMLMKEEKKKRKSLVFSNWRKNGRNGCFFCISPKTNCFYPLQVGEGRGYICSPESRGVKWGGTSAIQGTPIVSFPWSTTPSPTAPTQTPRHPPPLCPDKKGQGQAQFQSTGPRRSH